MWTVTIILHAIAASGSLLLGAFQLLRPTKGDTFHKLLGRSWVLCMYFVCITSFFIQTISGGFTWLHGLSLFTTMTVSLGLYAAIKGNIPAHKANMIGSYAGSIAAFVGVVAVPSRRIPQLALHQTPLFVLFLLLVLITVGAFSYGLYLFAKKRQIRTQLRT